MYEAVKISYSKGIPIIHDYRFYSMSILDLYVSPSCLGKIMSVSFSSIFLLKELQSMFLFKKGCPTNVENIYYLISLHFRNVDRIEFRH